MVSQCVIQHLLDTTRTPIQPYACTHTDRCQLARSNDIRVCWHHFVAVDVAIDARGKPMLVFGVIPNADIHDGCWGHGEWLLQQRKLLSLIQKVVYPSCVLMVHCAYQALMFRVFACKQAKPMSLAIGNSLSGITESIEAAVARRQADRQAGGRTRRQARQSNEDENDKCVELATNAVSLCRQLYGLHWSIVGTE